MYILANLFDSSFALRLEFDVSVIKEKVHSFKVSGVDVQTNWFSIGQLHVLEVQKRLCIRAPRWHYNLLKTISDFFFFLM